MAGKDQNIEEKIRRYETNNLACARIILSDEGRYGGEGSLMIQWAKSVIDRSKCNNDARLRAETQLEFEQ